MKVNLSEEQKKEHLDWIRGLYASVIWHLEEEADLQKILEKMTIRHRALTKCIKEGFSRENVRTKFEIVYIPEGKECVILEKVQR